MRSKIMETIRTPYVIKKNAGGIIIGLGKEEYRKSKGKTHRRLDNSQKDSASTARIQQNK
jgi:hypothetical protein